MHTHYTLIGSQTSPYVRRLRLYLEDVPYTFDNLDFWTKKEDDERLTKLNPVKKIPILKIKNSEGESTLWDSRVIFNYLQKQLDRTELNNEQENIITATDALQDSLILEFMFQRNEHPIELNNSYWKRQIERRKEILAYLDTKIQIGALHDWDYPSMALFTVLDWGLFRKRLSPEELPKSVLKFPTLWEKRPGVVATDPRKI